ncbi:hypothetical protein GBAR_LOCUS10427, partial [Geodia barretti]
PSVCYHVFCDYAQRDNKIAIPSDFLNFNLQLNSNLCVGKEVLVHSCLFEQKFLGQEPMQSFCSKYWLAYNVELHLSN